MHAARFVLWPLAWLGGIALQLHEPRLFAIGAYALLLLVALAVFVVAWRWRPRRWIATWLGAAALVALGYASTGWRAAERLHDRLDKALEGQDLVVVGVVAKLPQSNLAGTRFTFDVESAQRQGATVRVPRRVALGWYRGPDADALIVGPQLDLRAGQRWRFAVRLRQPHGHVNPHGFDHELWLFEQGIGATGYVRSRAGALAQKLADDAGHPVEGLRQRLRDAIFRDVPDAAAAGVIAALAIGDQGAIDRDDWELFRVTGVAHLMSEKC